MSKITLAVRRDEKPWTAAEQKLVRNTLETDHERIQEELDQSSRDMRDLLRDGVDGAGHDEVDVGTKSLERDAELSVAANQEELLDQTKKALARLDEGTYGDCDSCGEAIGKMRLMAFPRATLCITCKQREERR